MSKIFQKTDLIEFGLDEVKWQDAIKELKKIAMDVDAATSVAREKVEKRCLICGAHCPDSKFHLDTIVSSPSFVVTSKGTDRNVFFTRSFEIRVCDSCFGKVEKEEQEFQQEKARKAKMAKFSQKAGCVAMIILGITVGVCVGYWVGWLAGTFASLITMTFLSQGMLSGETTQKYTSPPMERLKSLSINNELANLFFSKKFRLGDDSGEHTKHFDLVGRGYFNLTTICHRIDI